MKRFAMILLAVVGLVGGVGVASAQMHGGSHGGGGWSGGHSGGSWSGGHSGGSWSGGHSGGNWNGGSWRGGGNWHGGHGSRVFVGFGFGAPWWGWPGYYPAYYPYYGAYGYYPYADYYTYSYDYEPSYIQQENPAYSPPRGGQRGDYSYYCPDPAGYYP